MQSTVLGIFFLLSFFALSDACGVGGGSIVALRQETPTEKFNLRGSCKPKNLLGGAACICYDQWKSGEITDELLDFCTRLFEMHPSELVPKCPPRFFKRKKDPTSIRPGYLRKFIFKSAGCFTEGLVEEPGTPASTNGPLDEEAALNKCILCLLCFKLGFCVMA